MAKNSIHLICVLALLGVGHYSYSQPCVTQTYLQQVGVREATNHNDGAQVEAYLQTVKLGKGYAWCAAFVKWCLLQCGTTTSINGWAATAINYKNVVYKNATWQQSPQSGDVFSIYSYTAKRVSHVGFYHRTVNAKVIETVEGNTNEGGSANGDGVYKRTRPLYSIHTISRWETRKN